MARFGDTVRPELGATDASPFLRGSMAGSAAIGKGIASAGQSVGQGFQDHKAMEAETAKNYKLAEAFFTLNPGAKKAFGQQFLDAKEEDSTSKAWAASKAIPGMIDMYQKDEAKRSAASELTFDQGIRSDMMDIAKEQELRAEERGHEAQTAAYNQDQIDQIAIAEPANTAAAISIYMEAGGINSTQESRQAARESSETYRNLHPDAKRMVDGLMSASALLDQQAFLKAGPAELSALQRAQDMEIGKRNAEWVMDGRGSYIATVEAIESILEVDEDGLNRIEQVNTGPLAGFGSKIPLAGNIFYADVNALEQDIHAVALKGLKATFGGQLSDGERKALMVTFFDRDLQSGRNTKKLEKFLKQLKASATIKNKMAEEIEKYGRPLPESMNNWAQSLAEMKGMAKDGQKDRSTKDKGVDFLMESTGSAPTPGGGMGGAFAQPAGGGVEGARARLAAAKAEQPPATAAARTAEWNAAREARNQATRETNAATRAPAAKPAPARDRIALPPTEEAEFQKWWAKNEDVQAWKKDLGNTNKSPDDPRERYDYRKAWKAGEVPQPIPYPDGTSRYHWESVGKDKDHPTYYKQFEDQVPAPAAKPAPNPLSAEFGRTSSAWNPPEITAEKAAELKKKRLFREESKKSPALSIPGVTAPRPMPAKPKPAPGKSPVSYNQNQKGTVRKGKVDAKLDAIMVKSYNAVGVTASVNSGGQPSSGKGRTGSHRHDDGHGADMTLKYRGRTLKAGVKAHQPRLASVITELVKNGANGIGIGVGYMGGTKIHVDSRTGKDPKGKTYFKGVWGKDNLAANAPKWAKDAYKKGLALR